MRYTMAPESVLEKNAEKLVKLQEYVRKNMVQRPYHNYIHAKDAARAYAFYGEREGLSQREIFLGISAMTAHDLICVPYAKDNEERTIEKVREVLPSLGYHPEEVDQISKIIYATKVGVQPKSLLEQIAKDSDLDHLGRGDFLKKNESLRVEWGVKEGLKWLDDTFFFMGRHRFFTKSAQAMRGEGFQQNRFMLNEMIQAVLDLAPGKAADLSEEDYDIGSRMVAH